MMMLVRPRRQPGWTRRVGQPGKADRQQDLAEQRGNPEPSPDSAPDARAHRLLASPPGAICAGQVRRYGRSSVAQAPPGMEMLALAGMLSALLAAINRE